MEKEKDLRAVIFMAEAFHGISEPETVINVGVSSPGVVLHAVRKSPEADFGELAEIIKKTSFKITRMGKLVGRMASERLKTRFGIVDLSLAPIPAVGDSNAAILEEMAIGMINKKTTAVRIIPVAGKKAGERVEFGGLLGMAPVMAISRLDSSRFIRRGGQIPSPIGSLTN